MVKADKRKESPIYFCYSENQHRYLQRNGQRSIGVGDNINTGKRFWQYVRSDELDRLLDDWSANSPRNRDAR